MRTLLENPRCAILLADAGPFNTLALLGELDLFQQTGIPLVVTDAVFFEVARKPESYEKDEEIRSFILQNDIVEIKTIYGFEMLRMLSANQPFTGKHFGERSIAAVVLSGWLEKVAASGPCLVLFEDMGAIRQIRTENTHMLSTVGFLRGLEECGIISDSEALIQRAVARGRKFPDYLDGIQ